jgi:hypothetical protein
MAALVDLQLVGSLGNGARSLMSRHMHGHARVQAQSEKNAFRIYYLLTFRAGVIFQDHLSRPLFNISGQSVSQPGPQYPCGRELSQQKSTYPGYPGIPIYYTPDLQILEKMLKKCLPRNCSLVNEI